MSGYVMGVDLGSTSAECVVVDTDGLIAAATTVETGTVSHKGMDRAISEALRRTGIDRGQLLATGGTGYGRRLIPGGVDHVFTEITSHARGVVALFPGVRLIIDIGGQDSKVILVSESGSVERFAMNDRCASGTGKSYEILAHALETDIGDLASVAMSGVPNLEISSLCATFAGTEIISLLARGEKPADIAASVHRSIAGRTLGLVGQVGKFSPVAFTGGVARNPAAVHYLAQVLHEPLLVPDDPRITGAYGAALLTSDLVSGRAAPVSAPAVRPRGDTNETAACGSCGGSTIGLTIGPVSTETARAV
jgi:(R)-2-hydroxyacyl-CoA dehydratese activating ATPase